MKNDEFKQMRTQKVKISYDTTPEAALDIALKILNDLGVEYEISGEETITIEYNLEKFHPLSEIRVK